MKLSSCGRKVCFIDSSQREIRLLCNVVPVGFREKVLRLAHETLLAEHLGIKKTLDRVVSEFFLAWSLW